MQRWFAVVAVLVLIFVAGRTLADGPFCTTSCTYLPLLDLPLPTPTTLCAATLTPLITPTRRPALTPSPMTLFITRPLTTAPPLPPSVTSTPHVRGDVHLIHTRSMRVGDTTYVYGEIENTTNVPVYMAQIQATLYDATQTPIASQTGTGALNAIFAQQHVPFVIAFPARAVTARSYCVVLEHFAMTSTVAYVPMDAEIQQIQSSSTSYVIIGTIRNHLSSSLRRPRLTATFYDVIGRIVTVAVDDADGEDLDPGQSTTYTLSSFNAIPYDHVVVQAQSYIK